MANRVCIECMEDREGDFCEECGAPTEETAECESCGATCVPAIEANCHECEADL